MGETVSILTLRCRYGDIERLSAELYSLGTLGIEEIELPAGAYELQGYFEAPFDASQLEGFAGWEKRTIEPNAWRDSWRPIEVGKRLWLAPEWSNEPMPEGRLRVTVCPGQGSGTSLSEPTLLMLEALERELRPEDTVVDVGTGSGILTAAAAALASHRRFAVDVDETSASEAAVALGGAASVWCGSPRSLRAGTATLTLANINAIQLIELAPELLRITAPGGRLLLGGFTGRNAAAVEGAFGPAEVRFERPPWLAFLIRRPG